MKVLIIGSSSDIGLNLAKKFRDNNHQVLITYNKNKIDIDGIETVKCDVLSESSIDLVIRKGNTIFGNDYVLINLASISMDNSFLNKTKQEFMNVLEVNLVGMFLCNQIYSRYNSNGLIVNMSSTDGIDTFSEYNIDYAVSKSGIITMSKIIGKISANKVICLCPNWIDSETTRLMNQDYLKEELNRIGQSRLISLDEIVNTMYEIITYNYQEKEKMKQEAQVLRIDIKDDKLWIEKE